VQRALRVGAFRPSIDDYVPQPVRTICRGGSLYRFWRRLYRVVWAGACKCSQLGCGLPVCGGPVVVPERVGVSPPLQAGWAKRRETRGWSAAQQQPRRRRAARSRH
jgi:hypothetical protein